MMCEVNSEQKKAPLVILTGPTAVGKTALSIKLAQKINGEIVSADSMQVYRGMDIGTAKITESEMQGIRHHLIDIIEPDEEFNVVRFKEAAKKACDDIIKRGKVPVLTGGTGFYIQALLYNVDFSYEEDDGTRKKLEDLAKSEEGRDMLYDILKEKDPESAELIHKNNTKRIIRALEFYHSTGRKISSHNKDERQKEPYYNAAYFVLNTDRQVLYERIDRRVDKMLSEGLLDEVKALKNAGMTRDMVSMQGLGYKEILSYLDGEISYDEAVRILKRDTRHFAKRQLTWFRREREVLMIDKENFKSDDEILDYMLNELKDRGIYHE